MDLTMGNVSTTYSEKIYRIYNNTKEYENRSKKSTEGFWAVNQKKTYSEHVELLRQWLIDRIAWPDAEFERRVSNPSSNE